MAKSRNLTEQEKFKVATLFTNKEMSEKEISDELGIAPSTVCRVLQAYGLVEEKPKKEEDKKLIEILRILEDIQDNMKDRTLEFKDIGFKDVNGTFTNDELKVNVNNRKIIFHYKKNKGTINENWETFCIDPNVIEAIWTEMKLRGWCWYK